MRSLSIILVIVIGLMTLAPVPAAHTLAGHGTVSIQAFDICHGAAGGADSAIPDCIHARCAAASPPAIIGVRSIPDAAFHPLLNPHLDEHPPRTPASLYS